MRQPHRLAAALGFVCCTPGPAPVNPRPSPLDGASGPPVETRAGIVAVDAGAGPETPTADAKAEVPVATAPRADAAPPDSPVRAKVADAGHAASGHAKEGETCASYGAMPGPMTPAPFQRPCAQGLVCCVPPHGAMMQVETAFCRVPCKPGPPSAQPAIAGCSANGCPWAAVP